MSALNPHAMAQEPKLASTKFRKIMDILGTKRHYDPMMSLYLKGLKMDASMNSKGKQRKERRLIDWIFFIMKDLLVIQSTANFGVW